MTAPPQGRLGVSPPRWEPAPQFRTKNISFIICLPYIKRKIFYKTLNQWSSQKCASNCSFLLECWCFLYFLSYRSICIIADSSTVRQPGKFRERFFHLFTVMYSYDRCVGIPICILRQSSKFRERFSHFTLPLYDQLIYLFGKLIVIKI